MSASSNTPAKKAPRGRGGKRERAGRKAEHGEPVVTCSVSLPPFGWAMIDEQRAGKVSRGAWILGLALKEDIRQKKPGTK